MSALNYTAALLLALGGAAVAQQTEKETDSIAEIQRMMDVQVRTATLRKQSLRDAPASVTVITAEDIRRYGYRTLAEALSNVRSFYTTSDGPFRYAGVRGFSLPGDYNTRFLVMLNGHQLTDNVYASMYYFGQDFPLDLDLVDQIEIVRGPSSALYGSNGLFTTVNVITKTPANAPRARVSAEAGSFSSEKLTASSVVTLGGDAKLLLSVSALHSGGRSVDFPDLAEAGLPNSHTDHVEAEKGYHAFANLTWKNWAVTAAFGEHLALAPNGWFGTTIGDTGTSDREGRDFVEAAWTRPVGRDSEIRLRTYYDRFRYDGVYRYSDYGELDGALGDWLGSQLTYQTNTGRTGNLTLGTEGNLDLRNLQYYYTITPGETGQQTEEVFRKSYRRAGGGVFVQDQISLSPAWTVYLGGRLDGTTSDSVFFSPRIALVHSRRQSSYKLMYGRAFRNPSTFERYWLPNPALTAERIHTIEFAREQALNRRVNLITSVYHYRLGRLIEGVPVEENTLQYQNTSKASATGVEAEINGHPVEWLETAASVSTQRTRGIDSEHRLPNSPAQIAQWRVAVPVARRRLFAAGAVHYVGSRRNSYGDRVPGVALLDVTASAPRLHPLLDFEFGIRNLLNRAYQDPLSPEHTPRALPGAGRSLFLKLTWRSE